MQEPEGGNVLGMVERQKGDKNGQRRVSKEEHGWR